MDLDWRLIFWINVPVLALGAAVMLAVVPETRDETATHRLDIAGLVVLALGLTAIVLPLIESASWGLGSARTLGILALGVALLCAFWVVEHRVSQPIVEFPLFRNGPYFGASAAAFALVGAYWSVMFFQPTYLQDSLGYSATATGLLILPVTVPMVVISPLAGRLIARFGARPLMTVGMLCGLGGVLFLTQIDEGSGYGLVLPGYLLFGVALGLVYAPMSSAAMAAMPAEKTGIASGVLAMDRVLAGAVGLALTGAIFQSLLGSDSFAVALGRSNWVLVGLLAVGTVLTWLFVRSAPAAPRRPRGRGLAAAGPTSPTTSTTGGSTCSRSAAAGRGGRIRAPMPPSWTTCGCGSPRSATWGGPRALLDWDQRTQMPAAGAETRAEQLATLARIRHERLVSDELGAAIEAAAARRRGAAVRLDRREPRPRRSPRLGEGSPGPGRACGRRSPARPRSPSTPGRSSGNAPTSPASFRTWSGTSSCGDATSSASRGSTASSIPTTRCSTTSSPG